MSYKRKAHGRFAVTGRKEQLFVDGKRVDENFQCEIILAPVEDDQSEDVYSVFVEDKDGCETWLADFRDSEDAELFARVKHGNEIKNGGAKCSC